MALAPDRRGPVRLWLAPQRRKGLGAALMLAAVAALAWWAWHDRALSADRAARGTGVAAWFRPGVGSESAQTAAPRHFRTGVEDLPASLAGTEVDGDLPVDAQGHLLVRRGVRNCFDYFLSLVGEAPMSEIQARLQAYLDAHLKTPARQEAQSLLARYLAYREAAQAQGGSDGQMDLPVDALQARLSSLVALRQQYFSAAEHQAFFGDEEALAQVSMASLRITRDASLGALEKAARLHQLMATLPADLQEAVGAQARYDQLTAVTDQLRREGGDAAALHQARVQIVGEEATGRLEALDAQRAQWQSRLADFQSRRSAILDDPGLSDSQRQAAVAQLTAQSFSPTEWTRAQALLDAPH